MRTIEVTAYKFSELPTNRAKERALSRLRETQEYGWHAEERESLLRFVSDITGRSLTRIPYDTSAPEASAREIVSSFDHSCVRGLTLTDAARIRDEIQTGYCADSHYREAFYAEFKRSGSAWQAFEHALAEGLRAWQADIDHTYSDEALIESCEANEYEFDADGDRI